MELRVDIEDHVTSLDRWKAENMKAVDASTMDGGAHVVRERRATVRVPVEGRTG